MAEEKKWKRLTKSVIEDVLKENDGYIEHRNYDSRNSSGSIAYSVHDGKLYARDTGKGGYAVGRYDEIYECDMNQIRRFFYNSPIRPKEEV